MARTERIYIRVTEEEKERLQKLADKDHRSISDYIRVQILKEEDKMLTEERLMEIMEEEAEKVWKEHGLEWSEEYEKWKESAVEAVNSDEARKGDRPATEEEVREMYHFWLDGSVEDVIKYNKEHI